LRFRYFIIHLDHHLNDPRGIFAVNAEGAPLYNVSFNHVTRRYFYNPRVIDYLIGDRTDEAEEVDRDRAEAVARELKLPPLPDEATLQRIVERSTTP
jgi:hypothetical protein